MNSSFYFCYGWVCLVRLRQLHNLMYLEELERHTWIHGINKQTKHNIILFFKLFYIYYFVMHILMTKWTKKKSSHREVAGLYRE